MFPIGSFFTLWCVVACIHLALPLPLSSHLDAGRNPRDIAMKEGGSNGGASSSSTAPEPAANNTESGNATSPLDCYDGEAHNISLQCGQGMEFGTESAADINATSPLLVDRGSLDRGLKILEDYSAALFDSTVSAAKTYIICL